MQGVHCEVELTLLATAGPHMGSAYPTIAADAAARFQARLHVFSTYTSFDTGQTHHTQRMHANRCIVHTASARQGG